MTEAEWLASEDPAAMLGFLTSEQTRVYVMGEQPPPLARRGPTDRKMRLFAAACRGLRYCAARSDDPVEEAGHMARCACQPANLRHAPAVAALLRDVVGSPFRPAVVLPRDLGVVLGRGPRNYRQEGVVSQGSLTPAVLGLARTAYAQQRLLGGTLDPELLAILADALEDAGCPDGDLLRHLRGFRPCYYCWDNPAIDRAAGEWCTYCGYDRWLGPYGDFGPGPHARGCWAVDLLLGKEAQGG